MHPALLQLNDRDVLPLEGGANFRPSVHVWSQGEIHALTLAVAAKRPLLLRGEPGCGKSQLARAAAKVLGAAQPLVEVIHPRFEPTDLQYRFDAMARMLDAQLGAGGGWDDTNEKYIEHGLLWRAFERSHARQPCVVLVDEVDKADADLPNSLLDVLANRSFEVPMRKPELRRVEAAAEFSPLVIFTTNEERELPAAFIRRCVVLNLNPPEKPGECRDWMLLRAHAHAAQAGVLQESGVIERVVDQTLADRKELERQGFPKVGLAEVVDLLDALADLTGHLAIADRGDAQQKWLDKLSAYALIKHPISGEGQRRKPIAGGEPAPTNPA
jgi:MoxR-like ATPase